MVPESSKLAARLLKERSRDSLVEGLSEAMEKMSQEEAIAFIADLLLTVGADRDHLKARLVSLLASKFGRSSEKASGTQLELFAEVLRRVGGTSTPGDAANETSASTPAAVASTVIQETEKEIVTESAVRRANQKAAREALRAQEKAEGKASHMVPWPTHLPVREETLPVPETERDCPDCGVERRVIRLETSWRIEYTTQAEVVVTHRPVVACSSHHGGPFMVPPEPKPVDKGHMGFGLAARLLWLRITHNLPVRRIVEMMQAEGVPVSEEMVHTLIRETGRRVWPLVEAIHGEVKRATLVNMDDTHVEVLDGTKERTPRKAHVWLALGDERFALFFATRSWEMKEAEAALGPIQGTLQTDGYRGFPGYARSNAKALAGCMSHLRRRFYKALMSKDPRANEPMALIQGLYRVEELADLRELDSEGVLALRQARSVPIWRALIAWAKEVQPTIETGSPLGLAWTYLSNQRVPLEVFLRDGDVTIDNNAAERGLRRITIGRKLWLFFRDQDKLEHVARLMGVMTTARLHNCDELGYLTWVLENLARREWSSTAARDLLPEAWRATIQQPAEEQGT